ncbi:hypothetical protein [Chakrabartyella piscis]|uniref:hypothetical protein n=1 Tax=Chakrabartyella piscis TaxID=2918914 RepID=UPI002958813B|nr:hypothetical protein [Chakrabartyella piscis]
MITEKRNQYPNVQMMIALGNSNDALAEYLATGGTESNFATKEMVSLWCKEGVGSLPREIVFGGTMSQFINLFPTDNLEVSEDILHASVSGVVLEHTETAWESYSCSAVILGCCTGEYLTLLNKKDK